MERRCRCGEIRHPRDGMRLEERAGLLVRGQQRVHLITRLAVVLRRVYEIVTGARWMGESIVKELAHTLPVAAAHVGLPCSARKSQARARAQSRFTVIGATPKAVAVSSTVRPAKNRSSIS